ncbi:MAG: DUF4252 domain-containing protein [Bacteroidales bacterium]|nr:DUF4252 domain-containing protein [Bacteroidales bacterium]
MKKALITLIMVLGTLGCAWAGKPAKVESLANKYKNAEGFEVVTLGRVGLSLIKIAAVSGGDLDEEDRAALSAFSGIRKITIVDFENTAAGVKERFCRELEKILQGMELILEAKDNGENLRIYGVDKGGTIRDCILYSGDGALICTRGSIDLEHLGKLMEMAE